MGNNYVEGNSQLGALAEPVRGLTLIYIYRAKSLKERKARVYGLMYLLVGSFGTVAKRENNPQVAVGLAAAVAAKISEMRKELDLPSGVVNVLRLPPGGFQEILDLEITINVEPEMDYNLVETKPNKLTFLKNKINLLGSKICGLGSSIDQLLKSDGEL